MNRVFANGIIVSLLCFGFVPIHGFADSIVADCTQEALQAALQSGGKVTFGCDGTIVLTNTIAVTIPVTLDGSGHQVTISGGEQVGLFHVSPGVSFGLNRLTLANGRAVGATGQNGEPGLGGGIFNERGTVSLTDCVLTNLQAVGGRGLDLTTTGSKGGAGLGGAIYNTGGLLNLTNCVLSKNNAVGGVAISSDFSSGGHAEGGGIWSSNGLINLVGTRVVGNAASGSSGQRAGGNGFGGGLMAFGGAVNVADSTFADNMAASGDGGLRGSPGGALGGAATIHSNVMSCFRTTFENNVVNGRSVSSAGGIYNAGTLHLRECEMTGNKAISSSSETRGGAILNAGPAVLIATTVASNTAVGGGVPTSGNGGGIFSLAATLFCTNVTFAFNEAKGGHATRVCLGGNCPGAAGQGGALYVSQGQTILTHVTFAGNAAIGSQWAIYGPSRGGALYTVAATVRLKNSLLAYSPSGSNCFGSIIDEGHNISSDDSCLFTAAGSLSNTDPKLSPLDSFGGFNRTMALLNGSPALDAADTSDCPLTDQRGVTRPFGSACDIGAFESTPNGLVLLPNNKQLFQLIFAGAAEEDYELLSGSKLPGWESASPFRTDANGMFGFSVTNTPGTNAFYGVRKP